MSWKKFRRCGVALAAVAAMGALDAAPATADPPAPIPPVTPSPFPIAAPSALPFPPAKIPAEKFAPINRPGPALHVPQDTLDNALSCTANARGSSREVVLFVPGTTATPEVNFGWNWFPAMDKLGQPHCSVSLPQNAMSDTQTSAEYVVNAIRKVHAISGKKIDIVGHSQGGTEPRFALRFWPELRGMVDDYIGLAATNHGSPLINAALCTAATGCSPSLWQQTMDSRYTQAMNSGQETFSGISYTQIYTRADEFVQPNLDDHGTTSLHGGGGDITNVAIQDVCPTDLASEHLAVGTYDPVAYALARDALDHPGPAQPTRVNRDACGQLFMPGVDPVQFPGNYATMASTVAEQLALSSKVANEPPLRPYTKAS